MHEKGNQNPENAILKLTYTRHRNYCTDLIRTLKRTLDKEQLGLTKGNPIAFWKAINNRGGLQTNSSSSDELLSLTDNGIIYRISE